METSLLTARDVAQCTHTAVSFLVIATYFLGFLQ